MSQLRGKRGEITRNRMAFEESYTIPSQLIVIFVQGLQFGLVNRGDEGAGRARAPCGVESSSAMCLVGQIARHECGRLCAAGSDKGRMNSPTCDYLVPLAKQGERGRVGLGERAALRQLVPFRGLESVRLDAWGLGKGHAITSNRQ